MFQRTISCPSQKFRVALLLRYDICFYVLCGLVLLSMGIKFFTGLARTRPWHIMMVIFKSLLWAWNYTLVGVLLEYLYFKQIADEHVHLVKEFRNKKYTPKERDAAEYKLWEQKEWVQFAKNLQKTCKNATISRFESGIRNLWPEYFLMSFPSMERMARMIWRLRICSSFSEFLMGWLSSWLCGYWRNVWRWAGKIRYSQ